MIILVAVLLSLLVGYFIDKVTHHVKIRSHPGLPHAGIWIW